MAEGVSPDAIAVSRYADIRYAGQAYELTLPVAAGAPDLGRIAADFARSTTGPTATPRLTRRSTSST